MNQTAIFLDSYTHFPVYSIWAMNTNSFYYDKNDC
jgi:hypothetical protein